MHPFRYTAPADATDVAVELALPHALPLGGGTDLLPRLRDGRTRADVLVDLRRIATQVGVSRSADGALRIGAGTTLAALARDPLVRAHAPALADAALAVGTPQLRAAGTLGGNLCQAPRCVYWRRAIPCHRTEPGAPCHARTGESAHHGLFGDVSCPLAHPSDPAVALVALEAWVEVAGGSTRGATDVRPAIPAAAPRGLASDIAPTRAPTTTPTHAPTTAPTLAPITTRTLTVAALLAPDDPRRDHALAPGEWITAVHVPAASHGGRQRYTKVTQREAWDFALVSLAEVAPEGGAARLTLGGVARHPWPVDAGLVARAGRGEPASALAAAALAGAHPLAGNGYKLTIAARLLEAAFGRLGATAG